MRMIQAWTALPEALRQTAIGILAGAVGGCLLLVALQGSSLRSLLEESGLPASMWETLTLPLAFLAAGVFMALLVAHFGPDESSRRHDIR